MEPLHGGGTEICSSKVSTASSSTSGQRDDIFTAPPRRRGNERGQSEDPMTFSLAKREGISNRAPCSDPRLVDVCEAWDEECCAPR